MIGILNLKTTRNKCPLQLEMWTRLTSSRRHGMNKGPYSKIYILFEI